jgi:hypothetical protein
MKTSHPRALEVARELRVRAGVCNAEGTMWSLDCCEADFNEILAELEAEGLPKPNKINYAAVDRLMSEGHEEPLFIDRTPDHPQGD